MPHATTTLALFPLQTVLFPGGRLPLQIFEPRYVDLVSRCLREGSGFGVVGIQSGREAGVAAVPERTGTLAEIVDWDRGANGLLNIVIRGTRRFRVLAHSVSDDQLVCAEIEWLAATSDIAPADAYDELRGLLQKLLEHANAIDDDHPAANLSNAEVAYRIIEMLPLSVAQKTTFLAIPDDLSLLTALDTALNRIFAQHSSKH